MSEERDISGELGPLWPEFYTKPECSIPMYSFGAPSREFWQGAYDALIAAGVGHEQAVAWLQSKNARWLMDKEGALLRRLGVWLMRDWIATNGYNV